MKERQTVNRKLSILLVCLLVVAGIAIHLVSSGREGRFSDKAQVEVLADSLISAIMQGNEDALERALHQEFVFDAYDMIVSRSQFIREVVKGDLWAKLSDDGQLEISGDLASLTAPFEANVVWDDEFLEISGTMTVDFVKSEKVWSARSIRIMPTF